MICVVEAKSRSDDGKLNNFSPIKPYFWIIGVATRKEIIAKYGFRT